MASPFGGHPRLNDYLAWACNTHKCTCKSGISQQGGKIETLTRIENTINGKHCIITMPVNEHLAPTTVAWLDRRLGLSSDFPKTEFWDSDN